MEYRIRKVKLQDLDGVARVEAICFPAAEAADRQALEQRIEAFPNSFFVAEAGEEIIGFINGAVTDNPVICDEMFEDASLHDEHGAFQSIFGLDVVPDYQRQGIAADLMNHLIEEARSCGRKAMILTCKDRLIPYYEKFGYRNQGVSQSVHGGAVWYDMILEF